MIVNVINFHEFEKTGVDCICQSINTLFQIAESSRTFLLEKGDETGITMTDIWQHHNIAINTSFILLHQGLEALLKAEICKHSPLLLLEEKRSDWPTLPNSKKMDFSELYQIAGNNLAVTFHAIKPTGFLGTPAFYELTENIRKIRNEITHVKPKMDINPINSLTYSLSVITSFYGKDKWLEFLRDRHLDNPLIRFSDNGVAYFWKTINFVWETLGKSECRKYLNVERQTRYYLCPSCSYEIIDLGSKDALKLSYLKPNDPASQEIYCLICGKTHKVIRKPCTKNNCKGNVLAEQASEEVCLTCFNI